MVRKESYTVHEACGEHQLEKDEARGLGVCWQSAPWKSETRLPTQLEMVMAGTQGIYRCSEADRAKQEVLKWFGVRELP